MDFLLIIDGSSLLSTQYYGNMPTSLKFESDEEKRKAMYDKMLLHTKDGIYTNGVLGFFRTLFNILREQQPTHLAIAWDIGRDTFRKKICADYKGTRKDTPEPLKQQFQTCQELCEKMGIVQFMDPEYEADDFCGSIARRMEQYMPVRILTKDKDYFQLITAKTQIWFIESSKEKAEELYDKYHLDRSKYHFPDKTFRINREVLEKEYGYTPETAVMVKALMGDSSDNIKGVHGVGPAVAIKLANMYKTIPALYADIKGKTDKELAEIKAKWKEEGIGRPPIKALLKESTSSKPEDYQGEDSALLSEKLGTIKTDLNLDQYFFFGFSPDDLEVKINPATAKAVLAEVEIKTVNTNFLT